ncbi:aminoacylase-1 [Manduca sexta]|uniref:N-acyl-aliphatic-L-amino acid amidohydrolase n=1 Tax=Manduca sexta TaxID=7130 RepID=A0A921ZJW7_MANSE|nr:aminoacylase-1 [Manduca sexta]KAG6459223.1 hypothetical protein O3G_MSEX011265 [Manduca sexta]KAG6459224.1 hypothetical protein O3G_MSEX011265 [Manduca sexta]
MWFPVIIVSTCILALQEVTAAALASDPAVLLLQEYVQINTTSNNNLTPAVAFWKKLADAEGLPFNVVELNQGYPIVVIKWAGSNSSISSIMLNSHMDVVPAKQEDGWKFPPFSAHIENGVMYGRGTQDMKSVSIQYYEALRRLKANGVTLLRDVYMTLMPDEELGAEKGMIPFLQSEEFAKLNVGVELDEGTSYDIPSIPLFYQDKVVWQIEVTCHGVAAHGSTFPPNSATATGKCANVINRFLKFRDEEYAKYTKAGITDAGPYTSVNLNRINGGVANNVIPASVSLTFDIRLGTSVNEEEFEARINKWIAKAGDNITLTYINKNHQSPATVISDSNPFWKAFSSAAAKINLPIMPMVPPGSTDARHVRRAGYPAFGFSPMPNTPFLLHSVNERLDIEVFLKGIPIYQSIIESLASIPAADVADNLSSYLIYTAD